MNIAILLQYYSRTSRIVDSVLCTPGITYEDFRKISLLARQGEVPFLKSTHYASVALLPSGQGALEHFASPESGALTN